MEEGLEKHVYSMASTGVHLMPQAPAKLTLVWVFISSCSAASHVHTAHYASTDVAINACTELDALHAGDLQDSLNVDTAKCSQSFMQLASSTGASLVTALPTYHVHTNSSIAKSLALVQQVLHRLAVDLRRELAKRTTLWSETGLVVGIGLISVVILVCGLGLIFHKRSIFAAHQQDDSTDTSSVATRAGQSMPVQPTAVGQRTVPRRSTRSTGTIATTGTCTTGTESPMSMAEHEVHRCPQLCQGLVVPAGSECVLAVRPAHRFTTSPPDVDVFDMNGKLVLKLNIKRPLSWSVAFEKPYPALGEPAVVLRSQTNERGIIATCREGRTSDGRECMFVYDSNEQVFARLTSDSDSQRYLLSGSHGDWEVIFDGNFRNYVMQTYNKRQEQLADAEPCRLAFKPHEQFYKLRISSGVDVGLIICCLVAIDEMEAGSKQLDSPRCSRHGDSI
mmetsp:Transcript_112796/g.224374  ORF Transcript_112796/g.224374 Transcript_112796/m.224374 type:complete len:449 (-) Transcript_112796:55-1401(-)|eukprot:CAMPEP_0172721730 /NCGR_PEP_ID=MMETSP1074-20121228/79757_1 /TAXON_ID=2916 /ORGANISM="Ceratium fusus, Strain PA161109" /LENGTH=448 /DNA_ID=CAMNT_0013547539 /DNA_START=60 /DNA_END=1406 /DNA_ORIENTATION=+